MDTAVALVQAYLNVNGYFTVVEYPVLEVGSAGQVRTVTDIDILAHRFAGAGHELVTDRGDPPPRWAAFSVDPVLGSPSDRADMIVGHDTAGDAGAHAQRVEQPAAAEAIGPQDGNDLHQSGYLSPPPDRAPPPHNTLLEMPGRTVTRLVSRSGSATFQYSCHA